MGQGNGKVILGKRIALYVKLQHVKAPIMRKRAEEKFPSLAFRVSCIFLSMIKANTRTLVCTLNVTAIKVPRASAGLVYLQLLKIYFSVFCNPNPNIWGWSLC